MMCVYKELYYAPGCKWTHTWTHLDVPRQPPRNIRDYVAIHLNLVHEMRRPWRRLNSKLAPFRLSVATVETNRVRRSTLDQHHSPNSPLARSLSSSSIRAENRKGMVTARLAGAGDGASRRAGDRYRGPKLRTLPTKTPPSTNIFPNEAAAARRRSWRRRTRNQQLRGSGSNSFHGEDQEGDAELDQVSNREINEHLLGLAHLHGHAVCWRARGRRHRSLT
jgi:hypothetical protein